jgi:hypothetical protein
MPISCSNCKWSSVWFNDITGKAIVVCGYSTGLMKVYDPDEKGQTRYIDCPRSRPRIYQVKEWREVK